VALAAITVTPAFRFPLHPSKPNAPLQRPSKREGYPMQARIWIGILIGSTIGGFIPDLWGAGLFSYSSVLLSGIGAFVGLLIGYKLA